ncbi:uncharacterized protein LOC125648645 isoform X2 [Ostrea edulis]|uniref:uncharacterized protein LOC125648645 isoform X2 n=1 Tax=Ostrea edulis TaxID=37623 RepID=UPI0024AF86DA|nr:uncharacterized protein LOC125648645 isoform X2 [Ostrea edulis]
MGDVKLIFSFGLILNAIGVESVNGCEDSHFQGNCENEHTFLVCYNKQWHKANGYSFSDNTQLTFKQVCNCEGSSAVNPIVECSNGDRYKNINVSTLKTVDDMCPCDCEYAKKIEFWNNKINQLRQYLELNQKLTQINRHLSMDFKNLSSASNKRISANDERPSAAAVGYIGATVLALVIGGIVVLDFLIITRQIRLLWRATCR